MSQEMALGKIKFSEGHYRQAFRQLLPVAVYGRPEAQYAIGYMYYYGYGPSRDSESGIFWMTKAAECHYVPAIRALEMICENKSYCPADLVKEEHLSLKNEEVADASIHLKEKQDVVLESIKRPRRPVRVITPPEQFEPYTLQLFSGFKLADVKDMQSDLQLKDKTHIWRAKNQDKDWYVLTLGEYDSVVEAKVARNKLSPEVKELDPWIRKIGGLEALPESYLKQK
jgi:hypothetical protein